MVTPRQGYSEVNYLDIGLLDFLIYGREVNLGYTTTYRILTSKGVTNRSILYGSLIIQMLRYFHVPIIELLHIEIKMLISAISFQRKDGKFVKIPCSKNKDKLDTPKDEGS